MTSFLLRLLVFSSALSALSHLARAEVLGDIDVLPLVAERERANRDALRTWRGKCVLRHLAFGDEGHKETVRHTVEFVLDRTTPGGHSLRWRMRIEGGTARNIRDMVERPQPPRFHHGLLRGDFLVEIFPYRVEDGRPSGVAVRHRSDAADGGVLLPNPRFDPMTYTDKVEFHIGDDARSMIERAPGLRGDRRIVRREGDVVVIESRPRAAPPGVNVGTRRYAIDLSKGASLLSCHSVDSRGMEQLWEYDFEKVKDVWMVKRASYKQSMPIDGQLVVSRWRIAEFSETVVNELIDPKKFTWAALGVPKGCRVTDERWGPGKGATWRYDPEEVDPLRRVRDVKGPPWAD